MTGDRESVPERIGKYIVDSVLGRGAMGIVYLAHDPNIDRNVAIKTVSLPPGLKQKKIEEFQERFLLEARAAGKLNHSAIVTVYEADGGDWGGPPFIAMEYVEGETWDDWIQNDKFPTPFHLVRQAGEIAIALDYAHKRGVVHRDIKPANIIQAVDGHSKLMDFGIAKVPTSELTQEGQFLGTPSYMSPEQILGKPVDGRSDLFSFGTVLFELLVGSKPFFGESLTAVSHKVVYEEPVFESGGEAQEFNAELQAIILKLLEKAPEDRYQTGAELREDLGAFLSGGDLRHAKTPGPSPVVEEALPEEQPAPAEAKAAEPEPVERQPEDSGTDAMPSVGEEPVVREGKVAHIITSDTGLVEDMRVVLGEGWSISGLPTGKKTVETVREGDPDLLVYDYRESKKEGFPFLYALQKRLGELPTCILIAADALSKAEQGHAEELELVDVLHVPITPERIQRSLAPLLKEDSEEIRASLPEMLGFVHRRRLSGIYRVETKNGSFEMALKEGNLIHLVSRGFLDRWVEALGLDAPQESATLLQTLKAVDEDLPHTSEWVEKKRPLMLETLMTYSPGDPLICRRIGDWTGPSPIPVGMTGLLPKLVEVFPVEGLEPLKAEGLKVYYDPHAELDQSALSSEHGYLMSQCAKPSMIHDLITSGVLPEANVLRSVYMMLILGVLKTTPPTPEPFRLHELETVLEGERSKIRLQEEAVGNLAESLQNVTPSPYEILGVPSDVSFEAVREAYSAQMQQLGPKVLHPDVLKSRETEILLIKTKMGEAFLLLQAFFLQERKLEAESRKHDGKIEIKRIGESKTKAQTVSEARKAEAAKLFSTACSFLEEDKPYEASQYLKLALFYNPQSPQCNHLLGKINLKMNNPRAKYAAERHLSRAMELDPWNVDYIFDLAALYLAQRMFARCRSYIDKAQKIAPKDPRSADLRHNLRRCEKEN